MSARRSTKKSQAPPGILEIALWTRGAENFYCDLLMNQPFAEALMDAVLEGYLWPYRPSGQYSDIKESAKNLREH